MKKATLLVLLLIATAVAAAPTDSLAEFAVRARSQRVECYTSTREVTDILVTPDGAVWTASRGGIVWESNTHTRLRWTRLDGLPSNEVLDLAADGSTVIASTPMGHARYSDGRWHPYDGPKPAPRAPEVTAQTVWKGDRYTATLSCIVITDSDGKSRNIELPKSSGTHVSALFGTKDTLVAGMFGDGLYQFDGTTWTKLPVTLPSDLCEITAITEVAGNLCVGTRRAGRYEITLPYYLTKPAGPEPYNHNCQAIAGFRGEVFMSTLEDGLVVYGGLAGWRRYASPDISSNAPRQLAEFDGKLYVRHGSGKVDRFDGSRWELDVCRSLPRKQTSMIYSDGKRLYAGQWGGWSEFDGRAWSHFLRCPDLQGAQVTSILPEEDKMWVGTQGHGLAEVSRRSLAVKWHDERLGMPDDWIKCTGRLGTETFAGTFVGGLARMCDGKWQVVKEVGPGEVTALTTDTDTLYISTRTGIFRREPSGATTQVFSEAGGEVQALCIIGSEFWIGTRTGIYVAPRDGYRHE